jgi:hypothetical protein
VKRIISGSPGVFVAVLLGSGIGIALVLTNEGRSDPLWLVWAPLAIALCITCGAVWSYGLRRWSELKSLYAVTIRGVTIPITSIALVGVLGVNVTRFLPDSAHTNGPGGVLLSLSIVASIPIGGVMFGVFRVASNGMDSRSLGARFVLTLALRRLLQRLLSVVGWLAALVTFQSGALLALDKSLHSGLGRPSQYVLIVGGVGSVLVALAYVPARTALRLCATRLCEELFPIESLDDPAQILSAADSRQKVEQILGADRSIAADIQADFIILAPLLASAVAAFLPR